MSNFLTRFWDRITGEPHEREAPENEVVQQVIAEFEVAALAKGRDFQMAVIVEAHKAGLPPEALPYVFWTLITQSRTWPLAKEPRRALALARDLMVRSDQVPNYDKGFQLIPESLEDQLDVLISRMSIWAQGTLIAALSKELLGISKRHQRRLEKILRRHDGLAGKTLVYLYEALRGAAVTEPSWFRYPDIMQPLLTSLLR